MQTHILLYSKSLLLLISFSAFNLSYSQTVNRKVKETLICNVDQKEMIDGSFSLNNNINRIAFRIRENNKEIVVVDTLKGKPYDKVSHPVFSADGHHFAYTAKNKGLNLLIVDHNQHLLLDSVTTITSIQFSTDNKSLSYILFDGKNYFMVFNGAKGKAFDAIDENSIAFTADGNHIAYSAVRDKKQTIVFDTKAGLFYDEVGFPMLSSDGKHMAYWLKDGGKKFVIADNIKSKPYDDINSINYNKDGSHLAYHALLDGKHFVVYDGAEGEKFRYIHSLTFSPDGSHFACAVQSDVTDKEGFNEYALADGKLIGPYETVTQNSLRFNNNGSNFAFEVERHDEFFIIYNGKEQTHYSDVIQVSEIFSPNNIRFGYSAEKFDSKRIANIDEVECKPFDDVYAISFSPDSKRYAFSARLNGKEFVVLDDNTGNTYDQVMGMGLVVFDAPDAFHYLARKNGKIYLVEEKF